MDESGEDHMRDVQEFARREIMFVGGVIFKHRGKLMLRGPWPFTFRPEVGPLFAAIRPSDFRMTARLGSGQEARARPLAPEVQVGERIPLEPFGTH
jgi:hypothetical protein